MDLIRIGEKVLSWEKINREIAKILRLRTGGLTQGEVARKLGIERTFVSRLESLGEIRRGKKVALVGFPIKNKDQLLLLAKEVGIDFTLLLTQKERFEFIENKTNSDLFNQIISIISRLIDFDLIVFLGSDKRVEVAEKLFSIQVIGVVIGESPITEDKYVDPEMILEILKEVKVFSIVRRRNL